MLSLIQWNGILIFNFLKFLFNHIDSEFVAFNSQNSKLLKVIFWNCFEVFLLVITGYNWRVDVEFNPVKLHLIFNFFKFLSNHIDSEFVAFDSQNSKLLKVMFWNSFEVFLLVITDVNEATDCPPVKTSVKKKITHWISCFKFHSIKIQYRFWICPIR